MEPKGLARASDYRWVILVSKQDEMLTPNVASLSSIEMSKLPTSQISRRD
jgi:hypothetical protein